MRDTIGCPRAVMIHLRYASAMLSDCSLNGNRRQLPLPLTDLAVVSPRWLQCFTFSAPPVFLFKRMLVLNMYRSIVIRYMTGICEACSSICNEYASHEAVENEGLAPVKCTRLRVAK